MKEKGGKGEKGEKEDSLFLIYFYYPLQASAGPPLKKIISHTAHRTKESPRFNSTESHPPPAASYLLRGAELNGFRIHPG
jgi:hypothetical protein